MRDIISHHYFDLDAEAVYDVCRVNLPEMIPVLKQIIADASADGESLGEAPAP